MTVVVHTRDLRWFQESKWVYVGRKGNGMPAGFLSVSGNELDRTTGWRVALYPTTPEEIAISIA